MPGGGEAMALGGAQQQLTPIGEGPASTSTPSAPNPAQPRATSAGPKISLPQNSVGKEMQVSWMRFYLCPERGSLVPHDDRSRYDD